jgi:hypothetical protein
VSSGPGASGSAPDSRRQSPRRPRRSRPRPPAGSAYAGSNAPAHRLGGRPPHTPQQRRNYAAVIATIRAVVAGTAAHDPSICSRLFTQHYVESVNGLKGAAALSRCQQQIGAFRGELKLVRIEHVQGNDQAAIVRFVTTLKTKGTTQILQLVRSGDSWKVYAALRRVR